MKASFELLPDDLAAFAEFHHHSSPSARRGTQGCLIVGIVIMMLFPIGILLTTKKPLLEAVINIWPLLLWPMVFALIVVPYLRWKTRRLAHSMVREGRNAEFYSDCELTIGDEGLTEVRPLGSTTRKWASVERIVATSRHLFVYTSGIEAFVVPRRAFDTDFDFTDFADAISKRCGIAVERL